jgi:uncharacterized protein (DUF433 family)
VKEGDKQPYLTLDELADELGCTRCDVDAIIERGELPLLRLAPDRELVPRMALDAYQRRLRGEPPPTIEVELGGMVGLDSGAAFLGIETDELIDLLDRDVLPWGFDERGRRLMFPDDLRAHRMKHGYGENALRVIADANNETGENTGDDEELDNEEIARMVDERLPDADATLGTELDEVAVELGFDPAELFTGTPHYCLRPRCPDFNLPELYQEWCPACERGWMYAWRFDRERELFVRDDDPAGPRATKHLAGVGRASAIGDAMRIWAYLTEDPKILGGQPVIRGTRLLAETVRLRIDAGDTFERLEQEFPMILPEAFEAAYEYAKANPRSERPPKPWHSNTTEREGPE